MTPGKKAGGKSAGKTPTKAAKGGGEVADEQLDAWAREDAAAMAQLIALIPQVHLKPQDQGRQIAKKYMKKVKDTVSDKVARAATDKRAKKRAKFDGSEPAEDRGDSDADEDVEDSENDEEMSDDDDEEEAEEEEPAAKRGRAPQGAAAAAAEGMQRKVTHRATSRQELQELLAKKMQQFAGSRPKEEGELGEKASEARKRKREERQEKKKKLKVKEKQKQTSVPIPNPMPKEGGRADKKPQHGSGGEEAFSFGRIKMAGEDVVGGGRDKDKKYREQPEKLLKKIEDKKKKLEDLGGEDSSKGKAYVERQKWGASIDRAQGVKVKDDEGLLKKTIAKKTKVKAKRTEKWTQRAQEIEDQKSKRIETRNENVNKRIQERRDKKKGIKPKKSDKSSKPSKPKSKK